MMQTPELLIQNMLRPVLGLLPAALEDNELYVKLIAMARRLHLANVMLGQWTIAVGGGQGVGKTKLIHELYAGQHDLEPWLPSGGGRDETMPVLIQEDDSITEPKGFLRMPHSLDKGEPVDADRFKGATKGQETDCLLPVLRVPPACLAQPGDALLLLPGYETEHEENSEWQQLMRQAMAGASACAVVTDDQRMAADVGLAILQDMQKAGVKPIVVISGTELMTAEKRAELQASAADLFKTEVVICTGVGAKYRPEWVPGLTAALRGAHNGQNRVRKMQLTYLQALLRELRELMGEVQSGLALRDTQAQASQGSLVAKQLLTVFDNAVRRLRADYKRPLNEKLSTHFQEASKKLDDKLIANHQGWANGFRDIFVDTVGESQRRLRQDIEAAWGEPGDCGDLNATALAQATFKALGGPLKGLVQLTPQTGLQQRLGYGDAKSSVAEWSGGGESSMLALRYLLHNDKGVSITNEEFTCAVKELPALALEFCRFVQLMPEKFRVDAGTNGPLADPVAVMRQASAHFGELANIHSDIIRTIGAVMGVDKTADASSLPALFKALGLSGEAAAAAGKAKPAAQKEAKPAETKAAKDDMAATVKKAAEAIAPAATTAVGAGAEMAAAAGLITGAAALAAAGLIYLGINMAIRSADKDKSDCAQLVLTRIRDAHFSHYIQHFDEIMLTVRRFLEERLQIAYGLAPDLLRSDRLARALAELKALHDEIQEALAPRLLGYTG